MTQSRAGSACESVFSTVVGFGVAWAAALIVLPWFGAPVSAGSGFGITCVFTAISLVRGYAVRRLFVWLARVWTFERSQRIERWLRRTFRGW